MELVPSRSSGSEKALRPLREYSKITGSKEPAERGSPAAQPPGRVPTAAESAFLAGSDSARAGVGIAASLQKVLLDRLGDRAT